MNGGRDQERWEGQRGVGGVVEGGRGKGRGGSGHGRWEVSGEVWEESVREGSGGVRRARDKWEW